MCQNLLAITVLYMQPASAVAAASTVDNAIQRAALIFCGDKIPSLKKGRRIEVRGGGEGMKGSGRCLSDVAAAVCGLLFMEATDSICGGGRRQQVLYVRYGCGQTGFDQEILL